MQKSAGAESNKRLSFSIHINNHGTTNGRAANEMGNEMERVNYDFVDRAIVGRAASARRKSELKDTRRLAGWLADWDERTNAAGNGWRVGAMENDEWMWRQWKDERSHGGCGGGW